MKFRIDENSKLTIYNPEFDGMRNTLDKTLQGTIKKMLEKNMDAAALSLKIEIELLKSTITDDNAHTGEREAITPEISYRLVAAMQQRVDTKGNVIGRKSNKELLMDDFGNFGIVPREVASGQLSMFNSWDEFKDAKGAKDTEKEDAAEAEEEATDAEADEEAEDE